MTAASLGRLRSFVTGIAALLQDNESEPRLLEAGGELLQRLVARDDWLPEAYAQADPECYGQYLLHCDSLERFSVVSFVWGPGQATPVHDHTVWGLVGVLRGAELCQAYVRQADKLVPSGPSRRLEAGEVTAVSPRIGDIHKVANAFGDRVSISIHAYGGNIGALRRSTYDLEGHAEAFVSGYSNATTPNFWSAD
jgi:predicted metal-dependent enzyme (double-stranded beta helix superfamily)